MTVIPVLMGGCSNNLFQMAAAISYSLKHGCEYAIPVKIQSPHSPSQTVFYSPKLNYIWEDIEEQKGKINHYFETQFHYKPIPKMDCDYLIIQGYFQSFKYFQDCRNEILRLLNIPYDYKEGWTFIHHRLGDYRRLQGIHEIVSDEYLQAAIKYFTDKGFSKFMVFSDEPELAKRLINKLPIAEEITLEYSEGKTEIEDLSLMSSCQNGIMSASAFSWWGSYMGRNEDRLIVYPSTWFGEKLSYHDTSTLCPPEWQKI